MTQNHQSMLKCAFLLEASIALLDKVTPATNEDLEKTIELGCTLGKLETEIQAFIDRAKRKQLRREIREKMKEKISGGGRE